MNITLTPKQIQLILKSLEMSIDIADDSVTDDMYPHSSSEGFTKEEMNDVRQKTCVRIDGLLELIRLESYLNNLIK